MGYLFNNVNYGVIGPTVATEIFVVVTFKTVAATTFPISSISATAPLSNNRTSALALLLNARNNTVNRAYTVTLVVNNVCLLVGEIVA